MEDYYQVLGVSRSASDDDIKKAYRFLSRRFHPDANINNPDHASCEIQFLQVQRAYTQIMKERSQSVREDDDKPDQNNDQKEETPSLHAVAGCIEIGSYEEAISILSRISERTARWYYYSAAANLGRGNNLIALEHAKNAVRMEPGNSEYQRLIKRLEYGSIRYRQRRSQQYATYSAGNLCLALCAVQTFCIMCAGSGLCSGNQ